MINLSRNKFFFPIAQYKQPIPGARISKNAQFWYVPACPGTMKLTYGDTVQGDTNAIHKIIELAENREKSIYALAKREDIDFSEYTPSPREHQKDAIARMLGAQMVALTADCGLGKTYIAIHWVDEMIKRKMCTSALVICPPTLVNVWIDELGERNVYNLRTKKKGKYILPDKNYQWYVVNYEQIPKRYKDFLTLDYDVIIFDESTKIKNKDAVRADAIVELRKKANYCALLSGTIAPNGPRDLWHQFYVLDGGASLFSEEWYYLNRTHDARHPKDDPVKTFWVPTPAGVQFTKEMTNPLMLSYKREDCLDLPEINKITVRVDLSEKQRKVYNEMRKDLCSFIDGNYVVARNNLSVLAKFSQITGGFVKNEHGQMVQFPENPKFDALLEIIESIGKEKIVVWAWQVHEIDFIENELRKRGYDVLAVKGGMVDKVTGMIQSFKGKTQILVANQAVLGHGHTLTFCHYAIFYSNPFDWELRYQSESRFPRIGQNHKMFFYDIICKDTIDVKLQYALSSKEAMHNFLSGGVNV